MKNCIFIIFAFCFLIIDGLNAYSPKIYDALKVVARHKSLDRYYFEKSTFIGSELAKILNKKDEAADETFVQFARELNKKLDKTNSTKTIHVERVLLSVFDDVLTNYLLLMVTPTHNNQNRMRKYCYSNRDLIQQFNITMNMISRCYLARHNYTDLAFEEVEEIFENVAFEVAITVPICDSYERTSSESTVKKLSGMLEMLNNKLQVINDKRRQKFWNDKLLLNIIQKIINGSTNDQELAGKIQQYFEKEYSQTGYVFTAFVFNNSHPFPVSGDNIYIYEHFDKFVILTRSDERKHCMEIDTIEANIKQSCIAGEGTKNENIKKYLTEKCLNSTTVLVLDDSSTNFVFATNENKPNAKWANLSRYYTKIFGFGVYEQCLKKVFLAVINN